MSFPSTPSEMIATLLRTKSMGLKKAKTTGAGGKGSGSSRYMTRTEAKDGARVRRRREDSEAVKNAKVSAPGANCECCVKHGRRGDFAVDMKDGTYTCLDCYFEYPAPVVH